METNRVEVTVNRIKIIFFQKNGLPKEECAKDTYEILIQLGLNVKKCSKYEKSYYRNLCDSCLSQIREFCRRHHILWVDFPVVGSRYIKHGFTKDTTHINNSLKRIKIRMNNYKLLYKKVLQITKDQQLYLEEKN